MSRFLHHVLYVMASFWLIIGFIISLNWLITTLELLLMLFAVNSYYFWLIHGIFGQFLALYSAVGSWLMAKRGRPGPRGRNERPGSLPGVRAQSIGPIPLPNLGKRRPYKGPKGGVYGKNTAKQFGDF